ncbi:MAG: PEP/pyruvate-binding domain-containing protein [Alphaproteobacteria bacterium]
MAKFVVALADEAATNAERFGPKAANQAALGHAGLPTPGGFVLGAAAYFHQLESLGLVEAAEQAVTLSFVESRGPIADVRIGLFSEPIAPEIEAELLDAYRTLMAEPGMRLAVRSSSLMEDTEGSSFAGQFQTFLGIDGEQDFLTAVRACWGALWSPQAMRYMEDKEISAIDTAMSVLVQPLVEAEASGGGLSQTADGGMSVSATWGLGEALAQGEVVPDRYDLTPEGKLIEAVAGQEFEHSAYCHTHQAPPAAHSHEHNHEHGHDHEHHHDHDHAAAPDTRKQCLNADQVEELARYMKVAEEMMGLPVEVEWAMDSAGIKMLQARPLHVEEPVVLDEVWRGRPGLRGHPGGMGWGSGRACVINCECEISRLNHGDVLVTNVAGPALVGILPRVSAIVAELGGSTSHLASLGRERGIPMVLGVAGATQQIPDGSTVGVDGVAGIVRWLKPEVNEKQPMPMMHPGELRSPG